MTQFALKNLGKTDIGRHVKVVAISFFAFNLSMGLTYGTFGPLMPANQEHFGIGRGAAAFCMSLITLTIGVLSPVLGGIINRLPIRALMMAGASAGAVGFCGLAFTDSYPLALVMYALIGAFTCICGVLAPLTLISRVIGDGRGMALGIVNLPIVLFASPLIVGSLVPLFGRFPIYIGVATLVACLIPLFLAVDDDSAHRPTSAKATAAGTNSGQQQLFRSPAFWLMSLAVGLITGTGISFLVHVVPFGLERGMSLPEASLLVSLFSGSGLLGVLVVGWITDKAGGPVALAITAATQAAMWLLLAHVGQVGLFAAVVLLGICNVPVVALHGATCAALFGAEAAGKAMGFSYSFKIPFVFGMPPLVGLLSEATGGYALPFALCGGMLLIAAALSLAIIAAVRKRPSAGA